MTSASATTAAAAAAATSMAAAGCGDAPSEDAMMMDDEDVSPLRKKSRLTGTGFGSADTLADLSRQALRIRPKSLAQEELLTGVVATPCYRAPEVIMSNGGYTGAMDVWVGVKGGSPHHPSQLHSLAPGQHVSISTNTKNKKQIKSTRQTLVGDHPPGPHVSKARLESTWTHTVLGV